MDPLRHHRAHREPRRAERFVERFAEFLTSATFLYLALPLIVAWFALNGAVHFLTNDARDLAHGRQWDPPPWLLMNVIFSFWAFFTGTLVVIATNAQRKRDTAREEADANHREELAEQHRVMLEQNTQITADVRRLAEEIHDRVRGWDDGPGVGDTADDPNW